MSDPPASPTEIVNALTIDVDDYFHDLAFSDHVSPATWGILPSRVEQNVERLLGVLADHGVPATFFALGWIGERYPELIRRVVNSGHELASLGYEHVRASDQLYGKFLADIRLAKAVLEDVSGVPVKGYRAPGFSIGPENPWAFDCIVEAGYRYSSSVYPTGRMHAALDSPRFVHEVRPGLIEAPASTVRTLHANWPAGGPDAFRLLPYTVSRWSIRRINAVDRQPVVLHLRPWELDPEQPRMRGAGYIARLCHYLNLGRMGPRLRRLLSDFRWDRADRLLLKESG